MTVAAQDRCVRSPADPMLILSSHKPSKYMRGLLYVNYSARLCFPSRACLIQRNCVNSVEELQNAS